MESFLEQVAAEVQARAGQLSRERSERETLEAANATLQVWACVEVWNVSCGELRGPASETLCVTIGRETIAETPLRPTPIQSHGCGV